MGLAECFCFFGCEEVWEGGRGIEGRKEGRRTYEENMSPKKAFSFPISGSVFVNSVCALA